MALFSFSKLGKWIYLVAFNVITVIMLVIALQSIFFDIDPNICTMTYMLPVYYYVPTNHSRYHLYLYRETNSLKDLNSNNNNNINLNNNNNNDNNNNINSNNNNNNIGSSNINTASSASAAGTTPNAPAYAGNTIYKLGRPLRGVPVLFIPGNSGSYKQIRSIGSEAYAHISRDTAAANPFDIENPNKYKKKRKTQHEYQNELDIFTLDFEEELSAFGGDVMFDEAEYVNDCIRVILDLYNRQPYDPDKAKPTSVIIIGHSMGGIVARMSVLLPNHIYGSVTTIITLNTSHRNAPIYSHQSTAHFYHELNRHWSNSIQPKHFEFNEKGEPTNLPPIYENLVVISIGGGHRDTLIRSELTSLVGLVSADRSFSAITTSVPDVLMETDHQCILWCNEVVVSLVDGLLLLVHPLTKQNTHGPKERLEILRSVLHSHVPEVLGFTPFTDYSRYTSTMKQAVKIDTESLTDIAKKIDFEQSSMVTILHRPSLTYQHQPYTRVTSSSSPVESFYLHFRISDWINGGVGGSTTNAGSSAGSSNGLEKQHQSNSNNLSGSNSDIFNFALTTSLPLGEFTVVLYNEDFTQSEEISYKSVSFPPLPPLTKSNIESPATQLVLQSSDIKDYHSIFIGFPKSARKQKFVAIAQFYNATESHISVPPIGLFDAHRYTFPIGHSLVVNFSLPFYHNKYPLKVHLTPIQPKRNHHHDHSVAKAQPQVPVFLPTTYQYIPGLMEEGKFVYNCSLTKIKFHQSSMPSRIKINNNTPINSHHHQHHQQLSQQQTQHVDNKHVDNQQVLQKRIVVNDKEVDINVQAELLQQQSQQQSQQQQQQHQQQVKELQYLEINNHIVSDTIEHSKMQLLIQDSAAEIEEIAEETFVEDDVFEDVFVERPHLFMVLDPYISYEVVFSYDFVGSIGSMVFSYALSLFPCCYALFLWVFASQMNSWRKKDEFPNLLVTLRDESVILAPFFILIPIFIYIVLRLFGYTNPIFFSNRGLFPDPFIDSFMLEQVPPFWVIPFLFISAVSILSILIVIVNILFTIGSYINHFIPTFNATRLYIGNFQLSISKWLVVGTILVIVIHSALGLLAFLLFLLVSPPSSTIIGAQSTSSNTLLIKKKPAGIKSNSLVQRDLQYYQQSIFMMYLFAGLIMAPNLIIWIKHLSFEWQIFDSYELFILVAIAHICLSRIELNQNNLFLLRCVLIASSALVVVYAILLLYRILHFTLLLSVIFIVCHILSLKEKNN